MKGKAAHKADFYAFFFSFYCNFTKIFGVVLFWVYSVVKSFTEIKKTPK